MLKSPTKFTGQFLSQQRKVLLVMVSRLWIYDPDLEQVIIEPYSHNPEANPISLLLGDFRAFQ